ncbi:hypothetical protein MGYG_01529 [Nannizzia gypsea CBS 118893]|uniref:F-box domain-containing protein n=1 Tax=Arthroderma gypseum (strain ATCC MYA-4604 / CBS 118893) TaxID=535722 RepID=E5R1G6_ARTGP|nr:hypothetical protein MGYG_01529 [Nannizzia gypsea CBS 118893]EFQ98502.1 hypothetical protein MGYG_01529 [Nannizzia gypsea CBS 118893]
MNLTLQSCPLDIAERIIAYLDLEDIRNLRLTAKAVTIKFSQGRFRGLCRMKQLDLTAEFLQAFTKSIASRSHQLKHLCLVGLSRKPNLHGDAKAAGKRQECLADYLADLFNEIAKYNDDGCLEALTLRVTNVYQDGSRHLPSETKAVLMPCRVWFCAVYMWQVVLQALAVSRLRIQKLNLFNDESMKLCSLPCDRLYSVELQDSRVAESFSMLKSLSLSLCTRVFNIYQDMAEPGESYLCANAWQEGIQRDYQAEATDEVNFIGVAKLIGLCNRLEELNLHFFHLSLEPLNRRRDFQLERILQHIVEIENLPRLKRVRLRGIGTREADLLQFIRRTDPSELSLEFIKLLKGGFSSIIEYCTSDQSHLTRLYLDTLYELEDPQTIGMVLFPRHEKARTIVCDRTWQLPKAENWEQSGDDIKKPILFLVDGPIEIGTPVNAARSFWTDTEYGAW